MSFVRRNSFCSLVGVSKRAFVCLCLLSSSTSTPLLLSIFIMVPRLEIFDIAALQFWQRPSFERTGKELGIQRLLADFWLASWRIAARTALYYVVLLKSSCVEVPFWLLQNYSRHWENVLGILSAYLYFKKNSLKIFWQNNLFIMRAQDDVNQDIPNGCEEQASSLSLYEMISSVDVVSKRWWMTFVGQISRLSPKSYFWLLINPRRMQEAQL